MRKYNNSAQNNSRSKSFSKRFKTSNNLTYGETTAGDFLLHGFITKAGNNALAKDKRIVNPKYQRPYKWSAEDCLSLLRSVRIAFQENEDYYCGDRLILYFDEKQNWFNIVSGLNGAVTFSLILKCLSDQPIGFLSVNFKKTPINSFNISHNYRAIKEQLGSLSKNQKTAYRQFIIDRCHFNIIITDDLNEAFLIADKNKSAPTITNESVADPEKMGLIKSFLEKRKQKEEEINRQCDDLISLLSNALKEAAGYTSSPNTFVDIEHSDTWKNKYAHLLGETDSKQLGRLKKAKNFKSLSSVCSDFRVTYDSLSDALKEHNKAVAKVKVAEAYALLGDVEGRQLDKQQMLAIVKEAHNHLIIAGAGTGKTTTVVGKIKYLLKTKRCQPEDILVLSFTNASAAEMSERIAKETGCKIAASTFHKLGLNIITKAEGIKPRISQINLRSFIKEKLQGLMNDPKYVRALSNYLLFNKVQARSEFDFKSEKDYRDHLQLNPPVSLQNESVKSYGEMDIANFLFQNGVSYVYEADYQIDTRTSEYAQYHPDFYLPEYGIYIEYFGINRAGNVPAWFSDSHGMTASQAYQASMKWKRSVHEKNGTVMIECFAYEKMEGCLLDNLKQKLIDHEVKLSPIPSNELWAMVAQDGESVLDGIIELFETVINLIKSNNYTIQSFRSIAEKSGDSSRRLKFIDLLEPLFNAYDQELQRTGTIDFNDMINVAVQYIKTGKVTNPFTQVIVDEYQDISKARFSLLAALRDSRDYDLFCVGDDWQSIYRFAGSDINYILYFEKYWGPTTVSKIETTYRFTPSLINISGAFITQNPHQIKKKIRGNSTDRRFSLGEISAFNEKYAIEFMAAKLDDLPRNSSVFFIGRYTFDIDILKESGFFEYQYNNISGFIDVKYSNRQDLKICFMTAHKSKGLQADYVFIINNKSSRMGFPSKIQDDPILDLLLENSEDYPFAEERRLYYVALTRAKTKAFFLTIKGKESIFAKELHTRYEQQLKQEQFECPVCGGRLERKSGPYGEFFGCSNYKTTGCRYKRKIRPKEDQDNYRP